MKKILTILFVCLLSGCSFIEENKPEPEPTDKPVSTVVPTDIPTSDPVMEDPIDLTSFNSINVIVNKQNSITESDVPSDLVKPDVSLMKDSITMQKEAASAIEEMFAAAKKDGLSLSIGSGYRSYSYQSTLYNNYVAKDGEAAANRYSAKPGQSEHQTGLAADIGPVSGNCYLKNCFKDTEEGEWLKENAYKYGFILRYPEGKEEITGYIFEPWHFRYIGTKEAQKVFESGLTLEEYYDLID